MTKLNALTMTMIFKANSANYGESLGNVSSLKKIVDTDGKQHTYISRQALRYNIINELHEQLAGLEQNSEASSKAVIQYAPTATIEESPEVDFFGYMKTKKGSTGQKRAATVRLSHAIGQEAFRGDTDFLTNLSLADRLRAATTDPKKKQTIKNSIANSEINANYYVYTITMDLDQIGIDEVTNSHLDNKERARRVNKLLDTIQYLYRDIRGRREDLKPLFIIGGLYPIKNPIFESAVHVKNNQIVIQPLQELLNDPTVQNHTEIGLIHGLFDNDQELDTKLVNKTLSSPATVFSNLKQGVNKYYESN